VLVGYGRVSTREQNLARQQAALTAVGCAKCFFDKASGKNTDRPELTRMFDYVRPGDVLTVISLDRLGRSLEDLIGIVGRLKRQGVGFQSLHEKLLAEPDRTMSAIAKVLGISRSTLYKMLPELVPPATAQQRLDAQITALPADSRPGPPTVDRYDELLVTTTRTQQGA
jgi:DNA invertase Pin-like site-specific DNA recombinase